MQEQTQQVKHVVSKEEPIRPKDDNWMVNHAGRAPRLVPISFKKTSEERKQWQKVHSSRTKKGPNADSTVRPDHSLARRLTVHVKNQVTINRNKFKTTYTCICKEKDIQIALNAWNIKKTDIVKMYWFGKQVPVIH